MILIVPLLPRPVPRIISRFLASFLLDSRRRISEELREKRAEERATCQSSTQMTEYLAEDADPTLYYNILHSKYPALSERFKKISDHFLLSGYAEMSDYYNATEKEIMDTLADGEFPRKFATSMERGLGGRRWGSKSGAATPSQALALFPTPSKPGGMRVARHSSPGAPPPLDPSHPSACASTSAHLWQIKNSRHSASCCRRTRTCTM
jgi:hypothetical protein